MGLSYQNVPKDRIGNLLFRELCWKAGFESDEQRDALMDVCSRDILFWLNTFGWIFEARVTGVNRREEKCLPFITYEAFQDDAILKLVDALLTGKDIAIRKSRDMGASWMCLSVFMWFWLFDYECTFLCLSAKEEMVDKAGNPKCLFAKMLYMVERLPGWMKPIYVKTTMHLENTDTRSVIDGEATSANSSVSDRRMGMLLDEFAKVDVKENGLGGKILRVTADATNCRIFNSTPEGMDTGFYRVVQGCGNVIELHWSKHPEKNPGLYSVKNGVVTILDEEWHKENPGYEFRTTAGLYCGLRSPWYDMEWDRRLGITRDIAQELDMEFHGSGDPYFDRKVVDKLMACANRPLRVCGIGDVIKLAKTIDDYDERPCRTKLWINPTYEGKIPSGTTYTMAADIGTGTGASDSAMSIGDDTTGVKVFEYKSNGISPESFADLTKLMYDWFTTEEGLPFLIWDFGGPGNAYGSRIVQKHRLSSIYYYVSPVDRGAKRSKRPGCPSNQHLKADLLSAYRAALFSGEFITNSVEALTECLSYVHMGGNRVAHQASRIAADSGAGENHADIAYSEALLWLGMSERTAPVKPERKISPFSQYARFKLLREKEEHAGRNVWVS